MNLQKWQTQMNEIAERWETTLSECGIGSKEFTIELERVIALINQRPDEVIELDDLVIAAHFLPRNGLFGAHAALLRAIKQAPDDDKVKLFELLDSHLGGVAMQIADKVNCYERYTLWQYVVGLLRARAWREDNDAFWSGVSAAIRIPMPQFGAVLAKWQHFASRGEWVEIPATIDEPTLREFASAVLRAADAAEQNPPSALTRTNPLSGLRTVEWGGTFTRGRFFDAHFDFTNSEIIVQWNSATGKASKYLSIEPLIALASAYDDNWRVVKGTSSDTPFHSVCLEGTNARFITPKWGPMQKEIGAHFIAKQLFGEGAQYTLTDVSTPDEDGAIDEYKWNCVRVEQKKKPAWIPTANLSITELFEYDEDNE